MRCHCVQFGPFRFHLGNKQMPVRYWFFLLATQYNSSFMNKMMLSSPTFRGKTLMKVKLCKVYTLECQQVDEICFRYNKICLLVWYFRKADDGCASTFPMASCTKKTCNYRKKKWRKKIMKIRNVFASAQLRITRLRKYPIDPKAYLGRWYRVSYLAITGPDPLKFSKLWQASIQFWVIIGTPAKRHLNGVSLAGR